MRILLTNDDGILAPGIRALRSAVADLGEVTVIAPDSPQSAVGRSITIRGSIACRRMDADGAFWGTAIAGRPADCVKLAIRQLMDAPPDLVLAGINDGANVGVNVFYSGTVAAAAEGALLGVPSVAFSLDRSPTMDFDRAGRLCRRLLDDLLAGGLAPGQLVSVNLPDLSAAAPPAVKVVPQGTAPIDETYTRLEDAPGRMLFQPAEDYSHGPDADESDVGALHDGFITVTPLTSDLTDRAALDKWRRRDWHMPNA